MLTNYQVELLKSQLKDLYSLTSSNGKAFFDGVETSNGILDLISQFEELNLQYKE